MRLLVNRKMKLAQQNLMKTHLKGPDFRQTKSGLHNLEWTGSGPAIAETSATKGLAHGGGSKYSGHHRRSWCLMAWKGFSIGFDPGRARCMRGPRLIAPRLPGCPARSRGRGRHVSADASNPSAVRWSARSQILPLDLHREGRRERGAPAAPRPPSQTEPDAPPPPSITAGGGALCSPSSCASENREILHRNFELDATRIVSMLSGHWRSEGQSPVFVNAFLQLRRVSWVAKTLVLTSNF